MIVQSFTTRYGGKSTTPYDSLNLAFHVGDDSDIVNQNHQILAKFMQYNRDSLIYMKQIHSNIVHIIDDNDSFDNPPTCDALITNRKGIYLMVMVADCTPVLFYDPIKSIIAVAHIGRAGAFTNIIQCVMNSFITEFGSDRQDIIVSSGASICKECYEVGYEIDKEAKELGLGYAIEYISDRYYLDIKKIIKTQLKELKVANIDISDECSCCSKERYFSYRADGITGRFAGVIGIKEKRK